ncbi:MAG: ABC transporter permease [Anaerolineae bacterium]|nr:ABC transporter permease [Anaerolineae bacterium]
MTDRPIALEAQPVQERPSLWRRFARHRLAVFGMVVMTFIVLMAIFAPLITQWDPYTRDRTARDAPPMAGHPFGTDRLGYDVWSRLVYSSRASLAVGLIAVAIYTAIGTVAGGIAGYYGGLVDNIIMRVADTILSFPSMIIVLTVIGLFEERSLYVIMGVMGFLAWPRIARLVRGQVLSIKEWEFVTAARAVGVGSSRIIWVHIMPNVTAHIIVSATFGIASAILTEASLSFLGLGDPTLPSWGKMLNEAQSLNILQSKWWLWAPPGLMIALCVLGVNFVGDGLRDALDPRMRQE